MMKPLLAAASFVIFAAPAFAQQTPPADSADKATEKFAKHDTNQDGVLSMDEIKVADASVTAADIDTFDANKDKALSKDEFAKWLEAKAPSTSAPGE